LYGKRIFGKQEVDSGAGWVQVLMIELFVHDFVNKVNFQSRRITVSISSETQVGRRRKFLVKGLHFVLVTWMTDCTKCSQFVILVFTDER
jgi:hypothetical protein